MHDTRAIQSAHAVEGPESLHPTKWLRTGEDQLTDRGREGCIAAFYEEPLRGFAPPRVGMSEPLDPLRGGQRGEWGKPWGRAIAGDDAVNATEMLGVSQVTRFDLFAQVTCQRNPVLNDAAVKIDEVKGPIRTGGETNRTKTFVGGSDEFLLLIRVTTDECALAGGEDCAANKIGRRLGDKGVAIKFWHEVAAIHPG